MQSLGDDDASSLQKQSSVKRRQKYDEKLGVLVLLRHGESEWNVQNRYTGWCDVDLTRTGKTEAQRAGRLLYENGIEIDTCHTSELKRAHESAEISLKSAKCTSFVQLNKTWRLNERHYGALQGMQKDDAYKGLGMEREHLMKIRCACGPLTLPLHSFPFVVTSLELVALSPSCSRDPRLTPPPPHLRRTYDTRPPPMLEEHRFWHGNDNRYDGMSPLQLKKSRGESLKDCAARLMPYFKTQVLRDLRRGKRVLVVSHANTLRSLIKHIDGISDEDIKGMSIPTGIPLLYRLDKDLKPVKPADVSGKYHAVPRGYTNSAQCYGFNGAYIGDESRLEDIQAKRDLTNRDWQRIILGNIFNQTLEECDQSRISDQSSFEDKSVVTNQLHWKLYNKMLGGACRTPEYKNMLLLRKMLDHLEGMIKRRQNILTEDGFTAIIKKLHLDVMGKVEPPFTPLALGASTASKK